MRKFLLVSVLGLGLGIGATQAADVFVQVGPPRPIVEHRPPRPSPHHIWIAGYHRWDGRAYVWEPGRWEVPPREHAVWVAPRWEHRPGGYVFIEGRWR
jgi:WXXGXW repeat (2 copies)